MSIVYNGTNVKKVVYNGTAVNKIIYNGVTVFTSEETFIPTWNFEGSWTNQNWGSFTLSSEGTGTATSNTIQTNGHQYLRLTPNSYGWRVSDVGHLKIYINNEEKYNLWNDGNQGGEQKRTTPLEIDISAYENITIKIELSVSQGYVDMYNQIQLLLHD